MRFFGLTAVAFLVTRSRSIMAIAAMVLLSTEWQRTRRFGVRLAFVTCVSFVLASAYGVYRDQGSPESLVSAITEDARFETSGESGLAFQVAAHVVGLKDAALLPLGFEDSILDKLTRAIPLFPGRTPMMADRYVRYFFPDAAAAGGGFAFSGVAEAYLFGSTLGVVCYGMLLGVLYGLARRLTSDSNWRTVLLVVCLSVVRSEFTLALITTFWGAVWVVAFRAMCAVFSTRRSILEHG
jgi:hypothetical protein